MSCRGTVRLALGALCALALLAAEAQELRVHRYNALKAEQKWLEAANTMREEIRAPADDGRTYKTDIRIIAIGALADYATRHGAEPALDEEAAGYFRDGMDLAGTDLHRAAFLRSVYARYFSDTLRSGKALPYLHENARFWRTRQSADLLLAVAYNGLAIAYSAMGEGALRDHYRAQALSAAAAHFAPGRLLVPKPDDWVQYETLLDAAMDDAAVARSVARVDRIWSVKRTVVDRHLLRKSQGYSRTAVLYAAAGGQAQAERLLEEAKQFLPADLASVHAGLRTALESDFILRTGLIHFHGGRYREAIADLERTKRMRAAARIELNDAVLERSLGQAYERLGDLERAAEHYMNAVRMHESLRQSFSVVERAAFFRSAAQRSYQGMIRVTARQSASGAGIERFWEAVQASEMVRARQLGDLLDPKAPPVVSRAALEAIRGTLGGSRAVLYYTLADDHLVILAFTGERHIAVLRRIEPGEFADSLRRVARDLSRPEAPVERIEQALASLGKLLLDPVAELLPGREELIVLPDGVLNLVPFDLLGAPGAGYRPLLEAYRVRLAPSLRFIGRPAGGPGARRLLALADPDFARDPALAGLEREELRAVTRGKYSEYFAPLPETRTEAEAIRRLFAGDAAQLLLGGQATKSAFKKASSGAFSHLHLATHGILGGEVPGVGEPALVLTAEAGDDGLLTASEIAALRLGAQLAVLSACNTGSGEYVTGEGVMGLSRAFLIAGSRSVVVSLWPVASQATERLMVAFYTNLRAGQDPHEALRAAKLRFRDQARRAGSIERHPMFWAPFVVFGG